MPWSIVADHEDCPEDESWAVVKDDGTVEGCHATQSDAQDQLSALYAQETNMDAPTDDVTRTADFEVVRADQDGDGLTLEGYAAVFNQPTRIDSFEGEFDEVIAVGAFSKTISDKGPSGIRLQFDHGHHPLIGSIPIGAIRQLREDDRGLFVSARLTDNWLIQPVRDAIDDGAIDGMSFRFRVVREEWDETQEPPLRTLKETELFELGPVVWQAYDTTTVGVRARQIADALTDEQTRVDVARALLSGTSADAAPTGTSAVAADRDDAPPDEGTRRTQAQRRQDFRRLFNPVTRSAT